MNYTFKPVMAKSWSLLDDKIVLGGKEIPLENITKVEFTNRPTSSLQNGTVIINFSDGKWNILAFPYKQRAEAEEAIQYIRDHSNDITEAIEKAKKIECRMRCNVCGKIFCYTVNDLITNQENLKAAKRYAVGGVISALTGTHLDVHADINATERHLNNITDYGRCPACHSHNVSLIQDDEEAAETTLTSTGEGSAADELKKFKELLDMGAITQEEFDAKKKQLLGL